MAKPTKSTSKPINWPLAIGIGLAAGGGAWLLVSRRRQGALALGPSQTPTLPQRTTTNAPSVPANAARRSIPANKIQSIQASLNLLTACGCSSLGTDGVWGPQTEAGVRCYLRKLGVLTGRPVDATVMLDGLNAGNVDGFLVGLQPTILQIIGNPAACAA